MKPEHIFYATCVAGVILAGFGLVWYAADTVDVAPAESVSAAALADAGQSSEPVVMATATLAQMVLAEPTATVYQTPTPNQQATLVAMELEAANKNLEASGRNATAVVQAAQLNAQAIQYQADAEVRISENDVILQTLINQGKEYDALMMSYAMQRDEIHLRFAELKQSDQQVWVQVLWAAVLLFMSSALVYSARSRQAAVVKAAPVKQVLHVTSNASTERVPAPPVEDLASVLRWCGAALAGDSLAIDNWEKSGRFIGDYRKLYSWAARWKLLMRHPQSGQTVLNQKGEDVVGEWMRANPLPHGDIGTDLAPISTVYTESVHTETEGEGLK